MEQKLKPINKAEKLRPKIDILNYYKAADNPEASLIEKHLELKFRNIPVKIDLTSPRNHITLYLNRRKNNTIATTYFTNHPTAFRDRKHHAIVLCKKLPPDDYLYCVLHENTHELIDQLNPTIDDYREEFLKKNLVNDDIPFDEKFIAYYIFDEAMAHWCGTEVYSQVKGINDDSFLIQYHRAQISYARSTLENNHVNLIDDFKNSCKKGAWKEISQGCRRLAKVYGHIFVMNTMSTLKNQGYSQREALNFLINHPPEDLFSIINSAFSSTSPER